MTQTLELSPFLKMIALKDKNVPVDLLERANRMPTLELQREYLLRYREEREYLLEQLDKEVPHSFDEPAMAVVVPPSNPVPQPTPPPSVKAPAGLPNPQTADKDPGLWILPYVLLILWLMAKSYIWIVEAPFRFAKWMDKQQTTTHFER